MSVKAQTTELGPFKSLIYYVRVDSSWFFVLFWCGFFGYVFVVVFIGGRLGTVQ